MKKEAAIAASMIRKELKKKYPNIKFSVTSDTYSGGSSITVEYNNISLLPSTVRNQLEKFVNGRFDCMNDMYEYKPNPENIPRCKHLFVQNRLK